MKKWIKFFSFGFFSHKLSREGAKRGYANFFLSLILALAFLWAGFIGSDMLPFSAHYNNSPDFRETARSAFANPELSKRIDAEIENGILKVKNYSGEYTEELFINTFEDEIDKQNYSVNGYDLVVDTRPADTLAEIEAYCVSNDGKSTVISYEDYLTLSEIARLNFDFKIRYTGNALVLNDELVTGYRAYVDELSDENKLATEKLTNDLAENRINENEYNRAIYELYFTNYYPAISDYEATSKVPLLRNYYYHQYIKEGKDKYLLIFDDYLAGSFEAKGGIELSFYGFYSDMENGALITDGATQDEANALADEFIKDSFKAIGSLNAYAYAINIFSLIPFIALMPMVVTLLAYSILKLRGVDSIASLGGAFKIVGSFIWASAVIAALLSVAIAFFVPRNIVSVLPLITFFIVLAIRSIIFVVNEAKLYNKQLEQEKSERTEV